MFFLVGIFTYVNGVQARDVIWLASISSMNRALASHLFILFCFDPSYGLPGTAQVVGVVRFCVSSTSNSITICIPVLSSFSYCFFV